MSTLRKARCISFEEYLALENGSDVKREFVAGHVHGLEVSSRVVAEPF